MVVRAGKEEIRLKVYIYYLIDPDERSDHFSKEDLNRFSTMLKSLKDSHFFKKSGYQLVINGIPRYLYAFTNDKTIAEDFEFLHNMELFNKIERKMEGNEYASFRKEMEHAYLEYEDLDDRKSGSIPLTKLENSVLNSFFDEVEVHLSSYADFDYGAFKEEYIRALDYLLYTYHYQMNGPDYDMCDYNFSYGQTPEGNGDYSLSYIFNKITSYYGIFKILLK